MLSYTTLGFVAALAFVGVTPAVAAAADIEQGTTAPADQVTFACSESASGVVQGNRALQTQTVTVPAGVTSATFDVNGAAGGPGQPNPNGPQTNSEGGLGGHSRATLTVMPGETLTITVGCRGLAISSLHFPVRGEGGPGYGYGGAGGFAPRQGGGGGGGSAVQRGSQVLLVAGGGGGGGAGLTADQVKGGAGGGANQNGGDGTTFSTNCTTPGLGATTTAVGTGGAGTAGNNGHDGDGPTGGSGTATAPDVNFTKFGGGGGGGGFFGGGAGGTDDTSQPCSGGGGGSGFADPTATNVSSANGSQTDDGTVTVIFGPAAAPTTTLAPTSTAPTTELARTGSSPSALYVALVMFMTGGFLVTVSRRRLSVRKSRA